MIGWLSGRIVDEQEPGKLILDVHGVGYELETSLPSYHVLRASKDLVSVHIHTVVREDAFLLYGFIDKEERELFRLLIKVNGIGPKTAIAILSHITPEDFVQAIIEKNIIYLSKLPGIGKKTAERLAVEMKDRFQEWTPKISSTASIPKGNAQSEAVAALQSLGYSIQESTGVIKKVLNELTDATSITAELLIRQSLKLLAVHL